MTRRTPALGFLLFAVAARLGLAAELPQTPPDGGVILKQARNSYYSLRQRGLDGFVVEVVRSWAARPPGESPDVLRHLKGLRTSLTLAPDGKTSFRNWAELPAANARMQSGFDSIFAATQQVISTFFQIYSPFMLTSPFPPDERKAVVDPIDIGYRVSWTEPNGTRAVIRMTKALLIVDARTTSVDLDVLVTPTFTKSQQGYILSAFAATFASKGAKTPQLQFDAQVDHAPVNDLTLPARLVFNATVNGVASKTDLAFANYSVTKRR